MITLDLNTLASRLNLRRAAQTYRGACPACGYPNAFLLRPGKGDRIWVFCASCRDDDAIKNAVALALGNSWTPTARNAPIRHDSSRANRAEAAWRLWSGSVPAAGTVADAYLAGRKLSGLAASSVLRFRADCRHPESGRLPAMVAAIQDASGGLLAVHRTYLRHDGTAKADVEPPRATLGPMWGGAVRLDPLGENLVIAEGIETAASAGRLLGIPAWSAVSAGNLARGLVLPVEVRSVVIAADRDRAGEDAARTAAERWRRQGRSVRIVFPDQPARDFNDALCGGDYA